MPDNSEIIYGKGGTVFAGHDAVELFHVATIASALGLYAKTGMKVNRAYTPTAMLAAAKQITGKTYKRGEYQRAADDLKLWCAELKAALPITVRE